MSFSPDKLEFPDDFLWGAAASSYQIEGAATADGKGVSTWDTFCRVPGAIKDGSTGDMACDHYHRYEDDVALMAELGLQAYRFSIAWPRVLPDGTGAVNQAGLDFYDRLVDKLLENGIQPFATLYHWDLPQKLEDTGGWTSRGIIDAFVNYADVVSHRLGDRVRHWMTHNEPWCTTALGYGLGIHAPGLQNWMLLPNVAHHTLVAHGKAVPVLRANGNDETRVGIVLNLAWFDPATDLSEDRAAAYRMETFINRWFLDPLYRGKYPADLLALFNKVPLDIQDGDMDVITTPTDFLGVNYYSRQVVAHSDSQPLLHTQQMHPDGEYTEMDWEVYPRGLYNLLVQLHADYAPPVIYVAENGAAFPDVLTADGEVHDERRVAYLDGHLAAAHQAIQDGVPLKGYFVWSLMDNFEWSHGYTKRFGITYVDYATQRRILKDSAHWYARAIRDRGFVPAAQGDQTGN